MSEANIPELFENVQIPIIDPNINFWLIRTNGGAFYDEFIKYEFVALAWNDITKKTLADITNENEKKIFLEKLEPHYKSIASLRGAWNKCMHFVNSIQSGDIIMIPNKGSSEITFAIAGDYYEDNTFTTTKELEVLAQIQEGWNNTLYIKCPYKKRRKIAIIKTVRDSEIHPVLYKALISYHGISSINDYSQPILSSIYDNYYYNNSLICVYNVGTTDKINAVALSNFLSSLSNITSIINGEENISAKLNLNSPGLIEFAIRRVGQLAEFLKNNWGWIAATHLILFGGNGLGFKFNSIPDIIIKIRESNSKLEDDKLDRASKELDIEKQRIENEKIAFELQKLKNSSINLMINERGNTNIVDISSYLHEKDDRN